MAKIKLQVALDFLEFDRAVKVASAAAAGGADYLEVGTPLIKSEGLDAVRRLREMFPKLKIIADMKTADAGKIEAEAAAKAGADVITVLGTASPATIAQCVEAGKHYGIAVAVDLLGVEDPVKFAAGAEKLGISWIDVHCPIDAQMQGRDPLELLRKIRKATKLTVAVAGGINSATAAAAAKAGADVVIVGGAITKATDPKAATRAIRKAVDSKKAVASENFRRATGGDIRQILSKVSTCNISDAAHRRPCLEGLTALSPGLTACGQAVTVRTFPGDWAKPVEAIDYAKPGDVIVIDVAGQPPAIWGELASNSAMTQKVAGVVINGFARDSADIRKMKLPLWSKGVCSHAGDPNGVGQINVPIEISGQRICPGDWIVADDDGVIVISQTEAVELTNRAADVLEAENRIRQEIRGGKSTLSKVLNLLRWEKKSGQSQIG